jgi:hypothetical protein
LLAGMLQSLWGVVPPTVAWGDADQAPVTSHLWALGLNPFGLLGAGSRLSFVQRDAAQRNLVHAYLAATTASVRPDESGAAIPLRARVGAVGLVIGRDEQRAQRPAWRDSDRVRALKLRTTQQEPTGPDTSRSSCTATSRDSQAEQPHFARVNRMPLSCALPRFGVKCTASAQAAAEQTGFPAQAELLSIVSGTCPVPHTGAEAADGVRLLRAGRRATGRPILCAAERASGCAAAQAFTCSQDRLVAQLQRLLLPGAVRRARRMCSTDRWLAQTSTSRCWGEGLSSTVTCDGNAGGGCARAADGCHARHSIARQMLHGGRLPLGLRCRRRRRRRRRGCGVGTALLAQV